MSGGHWITALAFALASASLCSSQVIVRPTSSETELGPRPLNTWKEIGPAPIANGSYVGRVSAIACSPSDPNRYFVGGADSGVWRTTDGGASWKVLTDQMRTTAIGAIAIDPNDEDVVYAGTGEANYANHSRYGLGLYKTTDGGETWSHLAEATFGGRCFSRLIVDHQSSQTLYAAITRAGGFPELAAAKGHPGASGDLGVFKSTDGGVSWARLGGGLPNLSATDLAMDPTNSQVLYAAIGRIFGHSQNGIYKTTDGGFFWTKLSGGLPTGTLGRISLAVAPSQPSRVYTLITNPATSSGGSASTLGAWRTDNGGTSWVSLPISTSLQSSYGWYLSVVGVDPSDADRVYMGGLTLYRSTTAGSSFSNVTPPHVDQHALAWDASGRLLAGDDGGVHRSTDHGSSWSSINDGLGTIQFYAGLSSHPTSAVTFYGGTQDNGSNRRSDASKSWTQIFGGDGGWTQVDPLDPLRVFIEYQGTGNLYLSTNGGGMFVYSGSGISSSDRNCFLPPYLIDPSDPQRMLYATHRIYRSLNGGSSWSALSADLTTGSGAIRALAMAPSDPSVVYVATNDGNVQVSTNGGSTFQLVLSGRPGWPRVTREITVHPQDPMTAYLGTAAFGVDQVQRTTDGGLSWESLDGDLPDIPVNVVGVWPTSPGRPDRLLAGTDSGLLYSLDDGATWTRCGGGLPRAPVIDLLVEPGRNRVVLATQGRGAWVTSAKRGSVLKRR